MSSVPEGLTLELTPDGEPALFDAQDVCWIIFTEGGFGDPYRWQASFIEYTCSALGVDVAFDEQGNEMTIAEFIEWYGGKP